MNKDLLTRRHFLRKTGIAGSAILGLSVLNPRRARAAGLYVRKDVGTLSATDPILTSYANAITAMNALDTSDPTNPLGWQYQAAIHGTFASSTTPGEQATWNTCQHGVAFFLSWHRMYLYYFERIIRKMSGDDAWALPFWNYESVSEQTMPAPFRTPAAPANPLYQADRGTGWNDGTTSFYPSAVSTSFAFGDTDWAFFWEDLVSTPHNAVHNAVGGLMGDVHTAAQDPIFFLHHCNIDRLWNTWLALGGGRSDPLGDSAWKTTPFTFFDENNNQVTLTGCDILRAQEQLRYSYDGEPTQIRQYCDRVWHIPPIYLYIPWYEIWPGPIELPVSLEQKVIRIQTVPLLEHLRENPLSVKSTSDVVLKLTDVEANHQPNVYYEVYLNSPGRKTAFESPSYLGNIALFGHGIRDIKDKMTVHDRMRASKEIALPIFTFKINRALEAASKEGGLKNLDVVFIPRGAQTKGRPDERRPAATIKIGKAEIGLQRLERAPR